MNLVTIGIFVIFVGIVLVFIGSLVGVGDSKSDSKVAVGGVIGFIPFGFGNDKKMVIFMIVISVFLMALFYVFGRFR